MATVGRQANGAPGRSWMYQRLLRGYGPLAVFAVIMVLIAWLVPSRVPKTSVASSSASQSPSAQSASSGSAGANSSSASSPNASPAATAGATHSGAVASSGGSGSGGGGGTTTTPGKVGTCTGPQVPGDPYSPPCTTFSGNNGGSTSPGVTATTINVTYRVTSDQSFQQTLAQLAGAQLQDTNADTERTIQVLANYFNSHFQFYGRKIVVHFFNGQGTLSNELLGQGQAQAEADALTAKQLGAFADISAESQPYSQDLVNQHIMAFGDPYLSEQYHQKNAPYAWSIATEGTYVAQIAANYAQQKLCPQGSPAVYAGGNLKNAPRKIGLLAPENPEYQAAVQIANQYQIAHGCGSGNIYTYTLDLGTESQQAANLVAKLKADGITTLFCGCDPIFPVYLTGQMAQQNYFPEFVDVGVALTDQDYVGQLYNQQAFSHAFGVSPNEPTVPYTQTIGYAAYKSVDPSSEPAFFVNLIYLQMDMLAIGIQMAGPDLTPMTFQQGMFNYQPRLGPAGLWGWSPSQYTVPNDVREICWDPNAISPFNNKPGAFVDNDPNERWQLGQIPKGPPNCPSGFPFTPNSGG
jgi:hypothetical protein